MRALRWLVSEFTFSVGVMILGATALAQTGCTQPKTSHEAVRHAVHLDDPSAKLTAEQRAQLIAKLERARTTTTSTFGALIVPSLQGETVEQVAERTFNLWQLGDNGILVVVAIQERKSRIETGNAVQRLITDDQASAIIVEHLNPHLRQGDFFGGLDETFDAVRAILAEPGKAASPHATRYEEAPH